MEHLIGRDVIVKSSGRLARIVRVSWNYIWVTHDGVRTSRCLRRNCVLLSGKPDTILTSDYAPDYKIEIHKKDTVNDAVNLGSPDVARRKMKLSEMLEVLHKSVALSTEDELASGCELIIATQSLSHSERESLIQLFDDGPVEDGDVISKSDRDSLIEKGFANRVIVNGADGYTACNYKGAWACRLINAGV